MSAGAKETPPSVAEPLDTTVAVPASPITKPVAAFNWKVAVGWTVLVIILLLFPFVASKQWQSVAVFGLIAAIGALGLNVLTGYTGLASFGHAFFLGIGGYTCAYFGGTLGWSFLLWLPLAGILAGLLGLVIGAVTLRFRGFYLTIVTLGLIFIGEHFFKNFKEISGGSNGRKVPAPAFGDFLFASTSTIGPLTLTRDQKYYFLILPLLILIILFVRNVIRTRMGRAFQAVRDKEIAAELMGINVARTRIIAFVFSSTLAGIGGALFASYLSYVQPDQWNLTLSIEYLAMIIIGGMASVSGAIIGALLVTALNPLIETYIDFLPFVQKGAGTGGITASDLKEILYAFFLFAFLLLEPRGIIGIFNRIKRKVMRSNLGKLFK